MKGARLSPDMMSCQEIEQFCHHIPMPGNGGSTHTLRSERARMIRVADHLSFTERSTGTLCFFPFELSYLEKTCQTPYALFRAPLSRAVLCKWTSFCSL